MTPLNSTLEQWLAEERNQLAKKDKIFYAVLFEVFNRKSCQWEPHEEYCHAEDAQRAKLNWAAGVPRHYKVGFNVRLVGIAPVIGVHTDVVNRGTKDEREIHVA